MEARKLEPADHPSARGGEASEPDEPFSLGQLVGLVHPYVWAWIAALWLGLACLILFEAS